MLLKMLYRNEKLGKMYSSDFDHTVNHVLLFSILNNLPNFIKIYS